MGELPAPYRTKCKVDTRGTIPFFKGYSLSLKVFADTISDPLLRFSEDSRIPSLLIEEEPVL
jgi:hypothetical protein